jgi:hypothetical protein
MLATLVPIHCRSARGTERRARTGAVLAVFLAVLLASSTARAQDEAPPEDQSATELNPAAEAPPPPAPTDEPPPTHSERRRSHAVPTEEILPSPPPTAPAVEPDPELTEDFHLPAPEPEWRLRAGIGASASTSGSDLLSLRLTQEIEWMPGAVAPFLFGITGGELISASYNIYLAGVRLGGAARFCEDRVVICSGAIAIRAGAIFGGLSTVEFDLGGDADARFRFDGVELTVRIGFFVVSGNTFIDAIGLLGAAL